MVFALSTSHEIGLAVAGAIFISFALLSSFVFPRRNPDFPTKKGLRWYVPLSAVFFLAMMSSVLYFGREKKEAVAATPPATSTATSGAPAGDPAAGKTVYATSGCSACHTFKPAGSTAKIGPDLDQLADYAKKAGEPLDQFTTESIEHPPPKYIPPGFPNNLMPPDGGKPLSSKQVVDLVAFLTSGS